MGATTHILAAAATTPKTTTGSSSTFLIFILLFGAVAVFMFRASRKRQRTAQDTQRQVMNGTKVRTIGGMFGTVVDSDDRHVYIEVAPGVRIKFHRQAIAAIVPDDEPDGVNPTFSATDETGSDSSTSSADAEDHSDLSR